MKIEIDQLGASLCAAVAIELRTARDLLEQLAAVLVADERFVVEYIDQFQAFDLIVQHVDETATLLERLTLGHCVDEAIGGVRLTTVQDRLRAAIA
ncbi:hypothetical protein PX699_09170 [Sphingobium sp. H39-3-25]|jgi:disulfide oxidoreductase YuzD|uniref:hypothetical protein n=1 Tax=Sphingobium arseniciresistens TaxID=3030834 RepID=UPI0023B9A3D9|nr:hypothetical protein [Sphingobium arseniciresistens]